jgi:glycosyltransferase involved in cell wall biosynthesis
VAPPGRLTLVGPLPPPSGGMANQTRQLAKLLRADGTDVRIVQTNAPYTPAWIGRVPFVRAVVRLVPYLLRLWSNVRGADVVHVMANSGWAWHLFAAPAIWIARLRGAPVVVNYRGGEAESFFERQFALIRPTLARAAVVVVPSGFLRAVFAKRGVETVEVPNIVDLTAFRPADSLPGEPHILVTRNLEPIYDIATAIRAFASVLERAPRARMTIAGSGPQRAELEQLATALGVSERVRFTGRLDNSELPGLYRTASVALNPSLADNMPISLLEAMASGVPIVSTNVGGIPHLVEDGKTAVLVVPGDPERMADAQLRVLGDADVARGLRANGLVLAASFSWLRVRPRLLAAYASAGRTGRGLAQMRASDTARP